MFQLMNLQSDLGSTEATLSPLNSQQPTAANDLATEGERLADAKAADDIQQGDIDRIIAELPILKNRLLTVSGFY